MVSRQVRAKGLWSLGTQCQSVDFENHPQTCRKQNLYIPLGEKLQYPAAQAHKPSILGFAWQPAPRAALPRG